MSKMTFTDEQIKAAASALRKKRTGFSANTYGEPSISWFEGDVRAALIAAAQAAPKEKQHASYCAIYNEPAMAAGPCNCGAESASGWTGEPRPHLRPDGIPTRCDKQWMSAAELAITEAMYAVERTLGASYPLMEAVCLLSQARDQVADHMEGRLPTAPASEQEGGE